jgi:hypothetical protein
MKKYEAESGEEHDAAEALWSWHSARPADFERKVDAMVKDIRASGRTVKSPTRTENRAALAL